MPAHVFNLIVVDAELHTLSSRKQFVRERVMCVCVGGEGGGGGERAFIYS